MSVCVSLEQSMGIIGLYESNLKTTYRSKRNWSREAPSICPRRFWRRCWQAGSEKLLVTFSMLVSIVCLQLSNFFGSFKRGHDVCSYCRLWVLVVQALNNRRRLSVLSSSSFPFWPWKDGTWLNRIRACHLRRRLRTYLKMRNLRKVH